MSEAEPAMTAEERLETLETITLALLEEATHDVTRFDRLQMILQRRQQEAEAESGPTAVSRCLEIVRKLIWTLYRERSNAQTGNVMRHLRDLGFGRKPN